MTIAGYKPHPACDLFPAMSDAELRMLAKDIGERGLLHPIVLFAGRVLDGRNRLLACKSLGMEARTTEWRPRSGESPTAYVISANLRRRHLDKSQAAMVAFDAEKMFATEAKERQRLGGKLKGKLVAQMPQASAGKASEKAAEAVGISPRYARMAKEVAQKNPEVAKDVRAGKVKLTEAHRQVRRAEQKREIEAYVPPVGEYAVIVADPPWRYEYLEDRVAPRDIPYPTMTTDEICALKIPAAKDCVLWLWTTNAHMRDAYRVVDAWGFSDKTILTWAKPRIGLGEWLRNQTEHCILAVRGKPMVDGRSIGTLLAAPSPGAHSEKPDEFFALIEKICPSKSRLELFARKERKGWVTSGSEAKAS